MCARKMHADEVNIDATLVRRLLDAQFPKWSDTPISVVPSAGTDNAIYRLGEDLAVRLPRIPAATQQVDKEQRWLPELAPALPLAIPFPVANGAPGHGYPWRWSVYRWLPGENTALRSIVDLAQAALALADFLLALQGIDSNGGPPPGEHNFFRGVPLAERDASTRKAIASLQSTIDAEAALETWEAALSVPPWPEPPVWIHGDLAPANLLVEGGQLSAVVDFGGLGVGDPACDLMIAWTLLSGESRASFRSALGVDEATWTRGQGWALSTGVIALPYYRETNPELARNSRRAIDETLLDHNRSG